MKTLVELSPAVEHRRGHGALYAALDRGWAEPARLRRALAGLPLPKAADGRVVLTLDVSNWLRPDAPTSDDRLFCHVYGRGARSRDKFVPGRPYSFVDALETGRTSWCALLDAVRPGPTDDATAATAAQLHGAVERLIHAGQWEPGDPEILIVMDSGHDVAHHSHVLADLPVMLLGRLHSDRVMHTVNREFVSEITRAIIGEASRFALARRPADVHQFLGSVRGIPNRASSP